MKFWMLGGSAALLLALAAGFFLNPVKTLGLARAVGGFFLEKTRGAVDWARDPKRDWWKIGCVAFGGLFAIAAFYADNQRREVITIREKCQTVETTLRTELVEVQTKGDLDRADLATCRAYMTNVVDGRQDTERENTEALLALERAAREADARAAAWKRRYDAKTPDCTTALAVLEDKCAALSDY
jgi:uncharacterized membrane protein